jgi:hypothetical protein
MHVQGAMPVLALLLALLVAPDDAPKTAGSAPQAAKTAQGAQPAPSRTIVGEIVWVDATSRIVLVRESVKSTTIKGKPQGRETVAIAIASDLPLVRGKKPTTLADLRPKDHVVARYVTTAEGARAVSLRVAEVSPHPAATPASLGASGDGDQSD